MQSFFNRWTDLKREMDITLCRKNRNYLERQGCDCSQDVQWYTDRIKELISQRSPEQLARLKNPSLLRRLFCNI